MLKILFINNPEYLKAEDVIWFDVPQNKEKEDLISSLEIGLNFLVGGTNWDSLDENLRTAEWTSKKKVVLSHHFLPKLNEKDLKTYLCLLNEDSLIVDRDNKELPFSEENVGNILKANPKWALIVIFPKNLKEKISTFLAKNN